MNSSHSPDAVRALAYQLWLDRGCTGGSPEDDWCRAEQMLNEQHRAAVQESALGQVTGGPAKVPEKQIDRAVEESFPASDPPAVHLGDEPPVNASEKWEAAKKAPSGGKRSGGSSRV